MTCSTAGVDVGARAEIYRILRDVAAQGTVVVIVSSDIVELEGLCDRVLVFSRGHMVGELAGDDVSEANIGRTMITATTHRKTDRQSKNTSGGIRSGLRAFAAGDYVPSLVLASLILLLGLVASGQNIRFISAFTIENILFLASALAFVSFGQLLTVLTGRIDLSVGPLTGLSLVIASFLLHDGAGAGTIIAGLSPCSALRRWSAWPTARWHDLGNFTAVAATLGISSRAFPYCCAPILTAPSVLP